MCKITLKFEIIRKKAENVYLYTSFAKVNINRCSLSVLSTHTNAIVSIDFAQGISYKMRIEHEVFDF